jgi:hypothetical protein
MLVMALVLGIKHRITPQLERTGSDGSETHPLLIACGTGAIG